MLRMFFQHCLLHIIEIMKLNVFCKFKLLENLCLETLVHHVVMVAWAHPKRILTDL